jgi:hypothetical protein
VGGGVCVCVWVCVCVCVCVGVCVCCVCVCVCVLLLLLLLHVRREGQVADLCNQLRSAETTDGQEHRASTVEAAPQGGESVFESGCAECKVSLIGVGVVRETHTGGRAGFVIRSTSVRMTTASAARSTRSAGATLSSGTMLMGSAGVHETNRWT